MQQLTHSGDQAVESLAQRYGLSLDAVRTMLFAVSAGGGSMAQFYHPELGGGGQWMRGGMTMVGDMFNHGLKATVSNLCSDLANLLASTQVFAPAPSNFGAGSAQNNFGQQSSAWPAELGVPSSSGGQNDSRYAYFPGTRRLAIARGEQITVYDTLDHQIGGVQQQQGGHYGSLTFSSQFGTFTVDSLPQVNLAAAAAAAAEAAASTPYQPAPPSSPSQDWSAPPASAFAAPAQAASGGQSQEAILNAIEKLGSLHQMGVLSDDEFRAKKAELLARL